MKKTVLGITLAAMALPAPVLALSGADNATATTSTNGDINYKTTDNGIQYWQGQDGKTYCKKKDGTVGLLVGAAVGVLIGRAIDTRGDRTPGTILGGVAGAIIGKKIAQGKTTCQ